jgi:hypothetical protein
MRPPRPVKRYVLVPRPSDGTPRAVRRFGLARVSVSPRSALGADRHERLERAAGHEPPATPG